MDNLYSEKVMDHFKNPRNLGEIEDADGIGTVGNPNCGDVMKIYIKVRNNKIADIKFQTLGCGAAIASSSIATELVKGKSLDEALKLSSKQIAERMGKFPPAKYHCSILAEEGIKKAILDFQSRKNKKS
ncbi:Fe-S cluster assembly scaffold protein NifU [Candidatus Berkelbacteria bacterium CG08_land_8_20_14_0_20_39_8]|uniref:Fe-S cluster assembly scaffold protein NifU n=1 Tax=Candidatus Berkelbacteria bacterium CG08_land_8_20_14_0_20_39_8 TaxID=1974511 RepID=A0A2M6YBL0_9BACT|nr:MAG: Fe-S cluster assembly scaffold protein NifU [Candidatus Berkelbacteria bacterium CG08_land_8_20_14_0_20_39_8]